MISETVQLRVLTRHRYITSSISLFLTKSLFDEGDELLLALVGRLDVVDELGELDVSVGREQEGLPGLGEEVDELCIVSRGNRGKPGVGGRHEGGQGTLQQLAQRRSVVGQGAGRL